jgi:hypothetical protein
MVLGLTSSRATPFLIFAPLRQECQKQSCVTSTKGHYKSSRQLNVSLNGYIVWRETCIPDYFYVSSSFSLQKENEAKEVATGKKYDLTLSHNLMRTKAGQTVFRAARGHANTQGLTEDSRKANE